MEALRQRIHHLSSDFARLADLGVFHPDYRRTLRPMVQLQGRTLVTLVRRFDETYGLLKSQIQGLDFADLEHQALRLLTVWEGGRSPYRLQRPWP